MNEYGISLWEYRKNVLNAQTATDTRKPAAAGITNPPLLLRHRKTAIDKGKTVSRNISIYPQSYTLPHVNTSVAV